MGARSRCPDSQIRLVAVAAKQRRPAPPGAGLFFYLLKWLSLPMNSLTDSLKTRYEAVFASTSDREFYQNVHHYFDLILKTPSLSKIFEDSENDYRKRHSAVNNDTTYFKFKSPYQALVLAPKTRDFEKMRAHEESNLDQSFWRAPFYH